MEEIELTAVQKKMEEFIRRERLLEMGDRVVLGVSGGADSVCMMELFAAIRRGVAAGASGSPCASRTERCGSRPGRIICSGRGGKIRN